jgi:hypothetical protein
MTFLSHYIYKPKNLYTPSVTYMSYFQTETKKQKWQNAEAQEERQDADTHPEKAMHPEGQAIQQEKPERAIQQEKLAHPSILEGAWEQAKERCQAQGIFLEKDTAGMAIKKDTKLGAMEPP